jgi:aryl-alcohol dehydrogenase-like predicted oxidoreductase
VEQRRLGRLGHLSSVLIFRGAALSEVSQAEADSAIALALESGINHFDTAAGYGESEVRLRPWMREVRDDVFLATKTQERSRQDAKEGIARSLERLGVDRVDLIQLHAIGDVDELDRVTKRGGALEAAEEARAQGLVGAIGITGHGRAAARTHLEALRRYPFDTVLTPLSFLLYQDADYRRDYEALVEEIQRQDAGLMIIKPLAKALWREGEEQRYATWYEPLDRQEWIDAAVAFVLDRREITGMPTAGDIRLLPHLIDAERRARGLTHADIESVLRGIDDYASPFEPAAGRVGPLP